MTPVITQTKMTFSPVFVNHFSPISKEEKPTLNFNLRIIPHYMQAIQHSVKLVIQVSSKVFRHEQSDGFIRVILHLVLPRLNLTKNQNSQYLKLHVDLVNSPHPYFSWLFRYVAVGTREQLSSRGECWVFVRKTGLSQAHVHFLAQVQHRGLRLERTIAFDF